MDSCSIDGESAMKFIDHPFILAGVFVCGCAGCATYLWFAVTGYLNNEPFNREMVLFGLFMFWGAWSSGSRLFGFRPTLSRLALEQYASELMELPYEKALEDARMHSTPVPHELALRKIKPASEEWSAFEKDGISFLIEKRELGGRAKVIIYK